MAVSVKEKFNSIVDRIGFNAARTHIKISLAITGTSQTSLLERLENISDQTKRDNALNVIARDSLTCGKRQYEVYNVTNNNDQIALTKYFSTCKINSAKELSDNYPYVVTDQAILESGKKTLSIIDTYQSNWDINIINVVNYTQISLLQVTEPASKYLNENGSNLAINGAVFTMKRDKLIQQFHVAIWCEVKQLLLLSVDRAYGLSQTESRDLLYSFKNNFSTLSKSGLGNVINLFDSIDPLYNETSGSITKLGLVTSENNPVRLSLSQGEKCIKNDQYHKLGEDNGYVDGKFLVAKEWTQKLNDNNHLKVSVELPGIPSMLDTNKQLTDFFVNNCSRVSDISFILKKLNII